MTATHADPKKKVLTDSLLRLHRHDDCVPSCGVCGKALTAGDYVDPFHPWDHAGNVHRKCLTPEPPAQGASS